MPLHGQCSICLECKQDTVLALPCGHIFHEECIKRWLDTPNSRGCSTCRRVCRLEDGIRIYFGEGSHEELEVQTNRIAELEIRVKQLEGENKGILSRTTKELEVQTKRISELEIQIKHLEDENQNLKSAELELEFSGIRINQQRCFGHTSALGEGATNHCMCQEIFEPVIAMARRYHSCKCTTGCLPGRCSCRKNGFPCNSRCHSATGCNNKSCSAGNDCVKSRSENTAPSFRRF